MTNEKLHPGYMKKIEKRDGDDGTRVVEEEDFSFVSLNDDVLSLILGRYMSLTTLCLLKGTNKRMRMLCHNVAVGRCGVKKPESRLQPEKNARCGFEECWDELFYPLLEKGGTNALNYLFGDIHFRPIDEKMGGLYRIERKKMVYDGQPGFEIKERGVTRPIRALMIVHYGTLMTKIARHGDMELWNWAMKRSCPYDPTEVATSAAVGGNLLLLEWLEEKHGDVNNRVSLDIFSRRILAPPGRRDGISTVGNAIELNRLLDKFMAKKD